MMYPKWYMYPAQMLFGLLFFAYVAAGKLLAPIMVPIGMATDWPKLCWAWNNRGKDLGYADDWWFDKNHWSWKAHPLLAEFWWRAVRNGFSNGARYALKNTPKTDLWQHPDYHKGSYKGPKRRAFRGKPKPWPDDCFRYEYDMRRWWIARYTYTRFDVLEGRYFLFYFGFKFDRDDGFGFSGRIGIFRNEDRAN